MRRFNPDLTYSLINVSATKPESKPESKPLVGIGARLYQSRGQGNYRYAPNDLVTCECGRRMKHRDYGRHLDKCRNRKPDLSLFGKGLYFSTRNRIKHNKTTIGK